jgi:magnesium transporter
LPKLDLCLWSIFRVARRPKPALLSRCLSECESRLSDKIQLLLDATLGFINIQQNDLFKILTIVSVVGVPPTILVGIWGVNFNMPEFNWAPGYPLAWLGVIASGLVPLLWFKWRGWFD